MKNKKALAIMLAVILFAIASVSANPNAKILFIAKMPDKALMPDDVILVDNLKKLGFKNITPKFDRESKAENAAGFDLVFISESCDSGKILDKFKSVTVPVLNLEAYALDDMLLVGAEKDVDFGKASGKDIKIAKPEHPMAAGLKDVVPVYKNAGTILFGIPSADATVIATVAEDAKKAAIFAYNKGSKDIKGVAVPAKRAFFYLFSGNEKDQTENGWKLLKAAIDWCVAK